MRQQQRGAVALEEEVPHGAAAGFARSVSGHARASLVETEFGVEKDSDLTHYQRTQLKAMTCGVGACTAGKGCDSSTFHKCMKMHPEKREAFVQAKLPHLKMVDGLIEDLPDDAEAEEKSEKGAKGVLGKIPTEDIAANCGAGACEFDKGCDQQAFTGCMSEKPGYVPKEGRVSAEAAREMMGLKPAKGKGAKGTRPKVGPKDNLAAAAVASLRAKVAAVRSL
uniref:Uncharacterized protein n=1 Tax=Hemiselmis tepida TaxID=464990 RepID=A0A7S0W1S3_9CRYP